MSRNGAGVYTLPASYLAETGDTVIADQHNSPLEDLQTDANTPRPIVAGGTGASSAVSARTNLSVMSVADIQSGYVPKVATKAALSALDTASFKAAVLTETTREKLWMWKSGDFSAEEAADTDNVNYIPADGVSTSLGCWVAATGDGVTVRTIAAGGTGADNAADARTNLGLEIGADVQAHSAVLDATTASFTTAQETKLSGIATGADVTSATNVNAAGAVMNTDTATTDMQFVGTGSDLSTDTGKLLKRGDAADAIDAAVHSKETVAVAEADAPASDPAFYDIAFRDDDQNAGSGGLYAKVPAAPAVGGFDNANGAHYQLMDHINELGRYQGNFNGVDDDQPLVQAVAERLNNEGGGTLVLPPLKMRLNAPIQAPKYVSIKGQGDATSFYPQGCDFLTFGYTKGGGVQKFSDFNVIGTACETSVIFKQLETASNLNAIYNLRFENLHLQNYNKVAEMRTTFGCNTHNVYAVHVGAGWDLAGSNYGWTFTGGTKTTLGDGCGVSAGYGYHLDEFTFSGTGAGHPEGISFYGTQAHGFNRSFEIIYALSGELIACQSDATEYGMYLRHLISEWLIDGGYHRVQGPNGKAAIYLPVRTAEHPGMVTIQGTNLNGASSTYVGKSGIRIGSGIGTASKIAGVRIVNNHSEGFGYNEGGGIGDLVTYEAANVQIKGNTFKSDMTGSGQPYSTTAALSASRLGDFSAYNKASVLIEDNAPRHPISAPFADQIGGRIVIGRNTVSGGDASGMAAKGARVPYASTDFTASGSMTWAVTDGNRTLHDVLLRGDEMTVRFWFSATTVGGTPSTALYLKVPGGRTIIGYARSSGGAVDSGTGNVSIGITANPDSSSTSIILTKADGANWTAGSTNTVWGEITFKVS